MRALRLKARLLFTPGVMMISVPYQLQSSRIGERRAEREVFDSKAGRTYADWSAERQARH